jgi:hypothetical protein
MDANLASYKTTQGGSHKAAAEAHRKAQRLHELIASHPETTTAHPSLHEAFGVGAFRERTKDRELSSSHSEIAQLHAKSAIEHEMESESSKATDATPSATVTAHCAATLLQDVPDATKAEIAWYEAHVDGGGSHSDGVINIRSKRQNGFISTTEKPTLDSIAAEHKSAVQEVIQLAKEQNATAFTFKDLCDEINLVGLVKSKEKTTDEILEAIYARAGANR